MNRITRITVSGFRSIRRQELELRPVNVLIGANGSGKSNLVALFRMLNFTMTGALQRYVGEAGGADSILHYGVRKTPLIEAEFQFEADKGTNEYSVRLGHAAGDTLIFLDEQIRFLRSDRKHEMPRRSLGAGHRETLLGESAESGDQTARAIKSMMDRWRVFQFHDTSAEAKIRQNVYINDGAYLRDDAGNLAAFLYGMRESNPECYRRIISTIRLVLPFFDDFILEPTPANRSYTRLDWREVDSDYRFGPHQIADGALRFMALATLLLQPDDKLPSVMIIDEPELGLHPYAITLLGSLIKGVSTQSQVILATQSTKLLDQFNADEVVVVDRIGQESVFRRLDPDELAEWLAEYTLSEIWEKNICGGRPSR